jgi:nucleoside-diphosphate-sugar epimerase
MSKVIVTGASGFLGRHVIASLLSRDCEVHAFSRSDAPAWKPKSVRWHGVDLRNRSLARPLLEQVRADGLIHLAWHTAHADYWTSRENLDWTAASLALLRDFGDCGGRRVVVAGSSAEYDWTAPSPLDEARSPLRPSSLYGHCKNALRQVLQSWAPLAGMSWAWGRIFNLYGPFEKPERLVSRVIGVLEAGRALPFDDGSLVRDFIHVADAADAFAALYASPVEGAVNIASGSPVSVRDVVATIAASLGRPDQVQFGSLPSQAGAPPRLVASIDRLRTEVGWLPRRTLADGLQETCDWWRRSRSVTAAALDGDGIE